MKVALCFWGLTRSLKFTIDSIREYILKPLDDNNIEYTTFMHTFSMSSKYYNPRAGEENIQLDFDEHHLLDPDFFKIEDQDAIKEQIQIKKYRTMPDPWNTNYICLDNFICAMYSKKQLGIMVKESNIQFDYIVYLRPDVRYITPLDQRYFHVTHQNTICTPNFHLFPNLNDRLAIIAFCNLKIYSEMFNEMYEYSRIYPLHSERFQYNILTRRFRWKVQYIPIHFNRVRADGREEPDTLQYYKKLQQISGGDNRRQNSNNATGVPSLAFNEGSSHTQSAIHTVFNVQKYKHSQPHEQSLSPQPFAMNSNDSGRTPATMLRMSTEFTRETSAVAYVPLQTPPTTIRALPELTRETSASAPVCVQSIDNSKRKVQPMFRSRKTIEQSS